MDPSRDSRYNLNYSMSIGLSMGENPDIYGNSNPALTRPTTGLGQSMNRGSAGSGLMSTNTQCGPMSNSRGIKRTNSDCFDDRAMGSQTLSQLDNCGGGGVPDVVDDSYTSLQKKSPPANGKKTKGRVKIKMEYIDNKLRRYTTFSKRKTGIMKKVSANSAESFIILLLVEIGFFFRILGTNQFFVVGYTIQPFRMCIGIHVSFTLHTTTSADVTFTMNCIVCELFVGYKFHWSIWSMTKS